LEDFDDESDEEASNSLVDTVLNSYLGPRALLAGASILYGTNFALGSIMNDALNPSAATCARMVLASLALGPFLLQLAPTLFVPALICGCFTATGYISQSLALTTVAPATVAFLGAATVLVCPTLEAVVNKKPMGLKDAPQVWLAAFLCLTGVAILELFDPSGGSVAFQQVGLGDFLSILQAVGFGTSFFLTERMMRGQPDQALPITAVQVSVTAFLCMIWCLGDGWIGAAGTESFGLPNMFLDPNLKIAAAAVAWTGLATTALNRFVETSALGKVSSAEASVILATEPLWAALFAALWLSDNAFGLNDYVGGALIVLACLANTLQPKDFKMFLGESTTSTDS
jgi:drug/metabolite transporter (DMT)-like permease